MQLPSNYVLDREAIKLNAYRLICHFYANKEIARHCDPDTRDDAIAKLEDNYFFREISRLLLEVAISIRVLDDQMKCLPNGSELRSSYESAMKAVNKHYQCMMFDEMKLREVCNKIIHADVVEPHIQEAKNGGHEIDHHNWLGWSYATEESGNKDIPEPEPIKWNHLTNNIRLGGRHHNEQWWHLLEVPTFVGAIGELLA
ncbi:hypothetical protein [Thiomicrorhabdus sp. 6S3-12]|uniref:hypothetical protein n=1 Tax=Thiomicrorhabdus sp. 6S3-12 TaxID=2819681 RepID=UPI001AADEAC8|nr:hypothetical protein [Thiomicrorhabdus sp. 6S3-12]MBO1924581.1 hypothetical protein [Thiomicrorhabdus sp. 6S3-12]